MATKKPIEVPGNKLKGFNQYLWADAVYFRNLLKFDILSDEKFLKLALIVNDVYQSVDLCYHVLEELDRRNDTTLRLEYFEALASS